MSEPMTPDQVKKLLKKSPKSKSTGPLPFTAGPSPFTTVLTSWCQQYGHPLPQAEFIFHPDRKWRFDYAWPMQKIALELEGGIWTGGAHTRGKHFESDARKYNEATLLGWLLIRAPWEWKVEKVSTWDFLERAFKTRRL